MPPCENVTGPPVRLNEDDMEELKEIVLEFLSKYEALYEKRIHKLVFYGEVYAAQEAEQRLTDATFMPYDHGPYSKAIPKALEELTGEDRVSKQSNGQYETDLDGGDLSPKKKYLIERIHQITNRMSTDEMVERAKDTWLWNNFEYAEEMDFAAYIDEIVLPPDVRRKMGKLNRDPVDDPDLERLLSS